MIVGLAIICLFSLLKHTRYRVVGGYVVIHVLIIYITNWFRISYCVGNTKFATETFVVIAYAKLSMCDHIYYVN